MLLLVWTSLLMIISLDLVLCLYDIWFEYYNFIILILCVNAVEQGHLKQWHYESSVNITSIIIYDGYNKKTQFVWLYTVH